MPIDTCRIEKVFGTAHEEGRKNLHEHECYEIQEAIGAEMYGRPDRIGHGREEHPPTRTLGAECQGDRDSGLADTTLAATDGPDSGSGSNGGLEFFNHSQYEGRRCRFTIIRTWAPESPTPVISRHCSIGGRGRGPWKGSS